MKKETTEKLKQRIATTKRLQSIGFSLDNLANIGKNQLAIMEALLEIKQHQDYKIYRGDNDQLPISSRVN